MHTCSCPAAANMHPLYSSGLTDSTCVRQHRQQLPISLTNVPCCPCPSHPPNCLLRAPPLQPIPRSAHNPCACFALDQSCPRAAVLVRSFCVVLARRRLASHHVRLPSAMAAVDALAEADALIAKGVCPVKASYIRPFREKQAEPAVVSADADRQAPNEQVSAQKKSRKRDRKACRLVSPHAGPLLCFRRPPARMLAPTGHAPSAAQCAPLFRPCLGDRSGRQRSLQLVQA